MCSPSLQIIKILPATAATTITIKVITIFFKKYI